MGNRFICHRQTSSHGKRYTVARRYVNPTVVHNISERINKRSIDWALNCACLDCSWRLIAAGGCTEQTQHSNKPHLLGLHHPCTGSLQGALQWSPSDGFIALVTGLPGLAAEFSPRIFHHTVNTLHVLTEPAIYIHQRHWSQSSAFGATPAVT